MFCSEMKGMIYFPLVVLLAHLSLAFALTPSTYLTDSDAARLKKVFTSSLPFTDLITAHYTILGYSLVGEKLPDPTGACKFINSKTEKTLESLYHATTASKLLGNCKINSAGLQPKLESVLTDEYSIQDFFYAVSSMKNLNLEVDAAKVSQLLTNALKKDDSVLNLGYTFHIATKLHDKNNNMARFFERIEDVIVQADEVDGRFLQFEGGLGITSMTIGGVYQLAEVVKTAPALTADQAVKFTNYFLSRKFVQTVKGAAQLLDVLKILSSNKYHVPVSMTLASSSAVSAQNPTIQVRITDVLGASLGPMTVTAESATLLTDNTVIFNKKPFQPVKGSNVLYTFNLMEHNPLRGFYKLVVSAIPTKADPRLVGNSAAQIQVKVMTEVGVENAEVGVTDRERTTAAKSTSVIFPSKLDIPLEADFHQKVFMKFTLKDKSSKLAITAHQVFVQFQNQRRTHEVVFVAEIDSNNKYRFDLDVYSKGRDFGYDTSDYNINLIVGDAVMTNSFTWTIGEVHLTFPANPNPPKSDKNPFEPKPEIKHVFREQEKRPSQLVSNTFSVLIGLPVVILLILWYNIGANVYNFSFSLGALGFHLGLGTIFSLFTCFWLHLNMFDTLKYLAGLCILTFISGHNLLSRIARSRKL